MIQFKHLTEEKCIHCGAKINTASYTGTHANGEQFEYVKYDCRYTIRWSPNFSKIEVIQDCFESETFKKDMAEKEATKEKIIEAINSLNLSDDHKEKMIKSITNIILYDHS